MGEHRWGGEGSPPHSPLRGALAKPSERAARPPEAPGPATATLRSPNSGVPACKGKIPGRYMALNLQMASAINYLKTEVRWIFNLI